MVDVEKYLVEKDIPQAEFDLQYDSSLSSKVKQVFKKHGGFIDDEDEDFGDIRSLGVVDKKKAKTVQKELKKIGVEEYDYS